MVFNWFIEQLSSDKEATNTSELDIAFAASCLLVEIMRADGNFETVEASQIDDYLINAFDISKERAKELRIDAVNHAEKASDLFQYTNAINTHWLDDKKCKLLEGLWMVALSDGELDKFEEHLVRRVADLIYLRHSDFIRTKQLAKARVEAMNDRLSNKSSDKN